MKPALMVSVAALVLTAPGAAHAATLALPAPCVRAGDTASLTGAGFAPGAVVTLGAPGVSVPTTVTADAAGAFSAPLSVLALSDPQAFTQPFAVTASDGATTASLGFRAARGAVEVRDSRRYAALGRSVRVVGAGLGPGRPVHVHILAGRRREVARLRLARRTGACGEFRARARLFAFRGRTRSTSWRYQFDGRRRFSRRTRPRATTDYVRRPALRATGLREKMIGPSFSRFFR